MGTTIGGTTIGWPEGRLAGRRIVVTGAASGIGRATAELFSREGARVALFDRDKAGLAAAAADIAGSVPVEVDIASEESVNAAVDRAAGQLGGLDGLVNAAGIMQVGPLRELGFAEWQRVIGVNLSGVFLTCRAALRHFEAEDSATIVNLHSGSALHPYKDMSAYIASKGGLMAFSRALAAELAPKVRVNIVSPGATNTPMARDAFEDPSRLEAMKAGYALRKLGEPIDIARAILFLTGPESTHVTGVTLAVDGGRTFH